VRNLCCKKFTETHAAGSSHLELAGRAFLQFLHHKHAHLPLAGLVGVEVHTRLVVIFTIAQAFESVGGLIKIQDNQGPEANFTSTKFCSDPQCVLSGEKGTQRCLLSPPKRVSRSICQGERWERVVCKLEQRRGAYRLRLQKLHVYFAEVCRRHVPLPVQANQGTKALSRVPKSLKAITNCINHALFKISKHQTEYYK
jgi:hypothetical protein